MSADRTPPADMSGYDRSVRTAKVSGSGDLSKLECRLILSTVAAAVAVIAVSAWGLFA